MLPELVNDPCAHRVQARVVGDLVLRYRRSEMFEGREFVL